MAAYVNVDIILEISNILVNGNFVTNCYAQVHLEPPIESYRAGEPAGPPACLEQETMLSLGSGGKLRAAQIP